MDAEVITRADLKRMRALGFRRMGRIMSTQPKHWILKRTNGQHVDLVVDYQSRTPVTLEVLYYGGAFSSVSRGYQTAREAIEGIVVLEVVAAFLQDL